MPTQNVAISTETITPSPTILLSTVTVTPTIIPPTTAPENLLVNGDFEEPLNTYGWELDRNPTRISPGYFGDFMVCSTQSLKSEDSEKWAGIKQSILVEPSKHYFVKVWLSWEEATQVHVKVDWFDIDDNRLDEYTTFIMRGVDGNSNGWMQKGEEVVAPPNSVKGRLTIWHGILSSEIIPGGVMCVDNAEFYIP